MKRRLQTMLLSILFASNLVYAQELTPFLENKLWGYKDPSDNLVIPANFPFATPFDNGIAAVKFLNGKPGAIDAQGKTVFELKGDYDGISEYYDSYAVAYNAKKVSVIDRTGKIVETFSAPLVQNAKYLGEGIVGVSSASAYWGYFTLKGKALTKFAYGTPTRFKNGRSVVHDRYNPLGGLIDAKGNILIKIEHKNFKESVTPGQYLYRNNNYQAHYTVIDEAGKIMLQTDFNYLHPVGGKRLLYTLSNNINWSEQLVGVLDETYTILTPEIFPIQHTRFENGKFVVTINHQRYFADNKGELEIQDGSFEYQVAALLLPEDSSKIMPPDTWTQIDRLMKESIAKGYEPAKKRMESLAGISFYQKKLASLKAGIGKQQLDALLTSAEKGDTAAMMAMAKAYLTGTGRQKDSSMAIFWLEKAVAKKNPNAAVTLAQMQIATMNPEKALAVIEPFKNDSICYSLFGRLTNAGAMDYFKGFYYDSVVTGLTDRNTKAVEFYQKAMAAGSKDAAYALGRKQFSSRQEQEGIAQLKENAGRGHLKSIEFLHYYYLGDRGGSINKDNKASYSQVAQHYYQQLKSHPEATDKMLADADRNLKKGQPNMADITPGTVIGVPNATGIKKVVSSTSLTGFYTQDGVYYSASARNAPAAYNGFVVLAGESDIAFRKICGTCNGHKTVNKQVKSGSYITKDVTYKTGSTISGDKKITTYTENNTYKTVSDQCTRCNGRGYTY